MTNLNLTSQKQTIRFNHHFYSSFLYGQTENHQVYFYYENNQIIQLIVQDTHILKEIVLTDHFTNGHSPTNEEIRILNRAQKNLTGIQFIPLLCSQNHHETLILCHALIDDLIQSQQIICLTISLNTKGYYEIIHLLHLLK